MKNSNEKKQGAATAEELAAKQIKKLEAELNRTKKQLKRAEKQRDEFMEAYDAMRADRDRLQEQYGVIASSEMWKITKPFRWFLDMIKRLLYAFLPTRLLGKTLKMLKRSGWKATMRKISSYRKKRKLMRKRKNLDLSRITPDRHAKESAVVFDRDITFSILVPLYNTPIKFLDEMIGSVVEQTYGGWELCLADGSDAEHAEVARGVEQWMKKDARIKYLKLEKNLGISENTNACIDMATGNYIALFDHDDVLHPSALYEMMHAICEQDADFVYTDEATFESPNIKKVITFHFKPDFAPDNLRANNYICHFSAFSREVLERAGRFRSEYDGSQDHDMILRLTSNAEHVVHIPKLLYFWRSHPRSVAMDINSKTYAIEAGRRAVRDSIRATGYDAEVTSTKAFPTIYHIKYHLKAQNAEKVSIMIPNKDHCKMLKKCISSILKKTTYPNYEILIIDNGSTEKELKSYYASLVNEPRIRILHDDRPFNFSAINNFAAKEAKGEYLVLLNNDIQIITGNWLQEMMMYVQREDVGAVGAMLYYPDNSTQHAGVILGLGSDRIAGHTFHRVPRGMVAYMGKNCYSQNVSAVTAACMMVKKSVYDAIGGMDESYPVAFNDVDFCLRIRERGLLIVWTPFAEAYHHESLTRGKDHDDNKARRERFKADCKRFTDRWGELLEKGDPYYNPNFSLDESYEFGDVDLMV